MQQAKTAATLAPSLMQSFKLSWNDYLRDLYPILCVRKVMLKFNETQKMTIFHTNRKNYTSNNENEFITLILNSRDQLNIKIYFFSNSIEDWKILMTYKIFYTFQIGFNY